MDRGTKITLKAFVEQKKKELDDFYHQYVSDWSNSYPDIAPVSPASPEFPQFWEEALFEGFES